MAKRVQLRRGTTAETNAFTGAVGELTVDTDKGVPVVHDGATSGGFAVAARANTDGSITFIGRNNTWLGSISNSGTLNTVNSNANNFKAASGNTSPLNTNNNGYTFQNDNDSGLFNPSDGCVDLAINGNPKVRHYGNIAYSTVSGSSSGLYPQYQCRAWVNFWGTGTVGIRAAGNVSSIGDNGVGNYTIWLIEAMPDAGACVIGMGETFGGHGGRSVQFNADTTPIGTNYAVIYHRQGNSASNSDASWLSLAFFR